MLLAGILTGLLKRGALSGIVSEDARGGTRFITLRKAVGYVVILPLLVCVLLIIAALLVFTALVAKLLSVSIGCLERVSMAFSSGKTKT